MTANGSDVPIKSALAKLFAPWIVISKASGYSAVPVDVAAAAAAAAPAIFYESRCRSTLKDFSVMPVQVAVKVMRTERWHMNQE